MQTTKSVNSPFDWRNKPSALLHGKDKHMFNGVNSKKSELATKANPSPIFLKEKSKVNNKRI